MSYIATAKGVSYVGKRWLGVVQDIFVGYRLTVLDVVKYITQYPNGRTILQIRRYFDRARPSGGPSSQPRIWRADLVQAIRGALKKGYIVRK